MAGILGACIAPDRVFLARVPTFSAKASKRFSIAFDKEKDEGVHVGVGGSLTIVRTSVLLIFSILLIFQTCVRAWPRRVVCKTDKAEKEKKKKDSLPFATYFSRHSPSLPMGGRPNKTSSQESRPRNMVGRMLSSHSSCRLGGVGDVMMLVVARVRIERRKRRRCIVG